MPVTKRKPWFEEPDLLAALEARDEALTRVADNAGPDWVNAVMAYVAKLPLGWQGTGEALRLEITKAGCPPPHNHNAWGSVIRIAKQRKLIKYTGLMAQMETKKSHARLSLVWRRE